MKFFALISVLCIIVGSVRPSPLPPFHVRNAQRQIRGFHIVPRRSVFLDTRPGIQVAYFKVGDGLLDLQGALGMDIPPNVIAKLLDRVEAVGTKRFKVRRSV